MDNATAAKSTSSSALLEWRHGISRFDSFYASHLGDTVHAPLPVSWTLPALPPREAAVMYLGVPPSSSLLSTSSSTTTTTTIFEHRPHLYEAVAATATAGGNAAQHKYMNARPLTAKRIPAGSQHRIVVHSPLYLAQFDREDRKRVLQCCAKWLHPSQGVLVFSFLDGGSATRDWCSDSSTMYQCRATLEAVTRSQPTPHDDPFVCHLEEEFRGRCVHTSLVFANTESGWRELLRRAGLVVVLTVPPSSTTYNSASIVTFVCRPAS